MERKKNGTTLRIIKYLIQKIMVFFKRSSQHFLIFFHNRNRIVFVEQVACSAYSFFCRKTGLVHGAKIRILVKHLMALKNIVTFQGKEVYPLF